MTEQRSEQRRSRRGAAADLVREGDRALVWADKGAKPVPCFVSHKDAGGKCWRDAVMEVYGLPFCEVHGAEAKAGALAELYWDASQEVERLDNDHVQPLNPEARRVLSAGAAELEAAIPEEHELLRRAYPFIEERADAEALAFDYTGPGPAPDSWYFEERFTIHQLMRIAYERGEDWLVEVLEPYREASSAQLAFVYADLEQRYARGELPRPKV